MNTSQPDEELDTRPDDQPEEESDESIRALADKLAAQEDEEETSDTESQAEPTQTTETPRKLRVKVDGEEFEIDEEEAVRGYQREQDYRRKTAEAAELRRKAEAERAAVQQERETRVNQLDVLIHAMHQELVGD
jgi:hypothetical protein